MFSTVNGTKFTKLVNNKYGCLVFPISFHENLFCEFAETIKEMVESISNIIHVFESVLSCIYFWVFQVTTIKGNGRYETKELYCDQNINIGCLAIVGLILDLLTIFS